MVDISPDLIVSGEKTTVKVGVLAWAVTLNSANSNKVKCCVMTLLPYCLINDNMLFTVLIPTYLKINGSMVCKLNGLKV